MAHAVHADVPLGSALYVPTGQAVHAADVFAPTAVP